MGVSKLDVDKGKKRNGNILKWVTYSETDIAVLYLCACNSRYTGRITNLVLGMSARSDDPVRRLMIGPRMKRALPHLKTA